MCHIPGSTQETSKDIFQLIIEKTEYVVEERECEGKAAKSKQWKKEKSSLQSQDLAKK